MATNLVNLLLLPGAVLLLPIGVTLWFRWTALHADEAKRKLVWAGYRSFGRFILAITVTAWWVIYVPCGCMTTKVCAL